MSYISVRTPPPLSLFNSINCSFLWGEPRNKCRVFSLHTKNLKHHYRLHITIAIIINPYWSSVSPIYWQLLSKARYHTMLVYWHFLPRCRLFFSLRNFSHPHASWGDIYCRFWNDFKVTSDWYEGRHCRSALLRPPDWTSRVRLDFATTIWWNNSQAFNIPYTRL